MPKFNWNIVFIFSEFIYRREILELSSPPHSFIFSQQNNMVRHSHHKNKNPQSVLMIFPVLSIIFAVPTNSSTKILEEMVPVVVPQAPTTEIKCGACVPVWTHAANSHFHRLLLLRQGSHAVIHFRQLHRLQRSTTWPVFLVSCMELIQMIAGDISQTLGGILWGVSSLLSGYGLLGLFTIYWASCRILHFGR